MFRADNPRDWEVEKALTDTGFEPVTMWPSGFGLKNIARTRGTYKQIRQNVW